MRGRSSCGLLDASGKEVKSFPSGRNPGWTSGLDLLPGKRLLVSQPDKQSVAELDLDGKTVWQVKAAGITTATRTPNGTTLVASFDQRMVAELDRAGKVVWEYREPNGLQPYRAWRR